MAHTKKTKQNARVVTLVLTVGWLRVISHLNRMDVTCFFSI